MMSAECCGPAWKSRLRNSRHGKDKTLSLDREGKGGEAITQRHSPPLRVNSSAFACEYEALLLVVRVA